MVDQALALLDEAARLRDVGDIGARDLERQARELLRGVAAAPITHVGDSYFEGWYSEQPLSLRCGQHTKQDMRDAYAAGLGEQAAHLSGVPAVAEERVVVTKDRAGVIVAVTRQDDEGRILAVLAEPGLSDEQRAAFSGLDRLYPTNPPVTVEQNTDAAGVSEPGHQTFSQQTPMGSEPK